MEYTYKYLGRLKQLREDIDDREVAEKVDAIIEGEFDEDDATDAFFLACLDLLEIEVKKGEMPANLLNQNTDSDGVRDNALSNTFRNAPREKRAARHSYFAASMASFLPEIKEDWMAESIIELMALYGPGKMEDGIRRTKFTFEILVEFLEEHPKAKGSQFVYEWLGRRSSRYTDVVSRDRQESLFDQRTELKVCREAIHELRAA